MCFLLEVVVVCLTAVILFAPWMHARADEMRENTRKLELENDQKEYHE